MVSAYEHFSPVGDTDSVLYPTRYIETRSHVGMDDQRVGDLRVTWVGDTVSSVAGRHGNPGTKF